MPIYATAGALRGHLLTVLGRGGAGWAPPGTLAQTLAPRASCPSQHTPRRGTAGPGPADVSTGLPPDHVSSSPESNLRVTCRRTADPRERVAPYVLVPERARACPSVPECGRVWPSAAERGRAWPRAWPGVTERDRAWPSSPAARLPTQHRRAAEHRRAGPSPADPMRKPHPLGPVTGRRPAASGGRMRPPVHDHLPRLLCRAAGRRCMDGIGWMDLSVDGWRASVYCLFCLG